ncbi:MAG: DEAD/DEAH box helicase [Patescibacteria group bacterium]
MVTYNLRDYQEYILSELKNLYMGGARRIIVRLPTGGGKGLLMSQIVNNTLRKGNECLTVLYGSDLLEQTRRNYLKYHSINSGIIQGSTRFYYENSNIASISTIIRRDYDLSKYSIVIIDEAHQCTSPTYKRLFDRLNPTTLVLGFSATPYAVNNKYLPFWEHFINGASYDDLKSQGFLVPYKYYAPKEQINIQGVKTINGDYDIGQLAERASESRIVGDIVDTYKKLRDNKRCFLFAVNIDHSKIMAQKFNDEGISAVHCDGESSVEHRQDSIERFKRGEIKVLTNVNIFSTGLDVPEAEVFISARPTKSLVLFIQQVGRVLRPANGKNHAIIIDHSSNYTRHGFPDDDHEPQIELINGKEKKERSKSGPTINAKLCPGCTLLVRKEIDVCPECGFAFPKTIRKTDEEDGEIVDIGDRIKRYKEIRKELEKFQKMLANRRKSDGSPYHPWWVWYQMMRRYDVNTLKSVFRRDFPNTLFKKHLIKGALDV